MDQKQDKIKITVKQGTKTRLVDMQDIIYIESIGRKAVLHLSNEIIEYYAKISELESQLSPFFFRTHRAYLVNLRYIENYDKREVYLKNAGTVLISKYRFNHFQKVMEHYHNS